MSVPISAIEAVSSETNQFKQLLTQEVEEQGGNKQVEQDEILQLIHQELKDMHETVKKFVADYGQHSTLEKPPVATLSSQFKEMLDAFKEKLLNFFHKMDQKFAFEKPIQASQGAQEAIETFQQAHESDMKKIATELEKPYVRQELAQQQNEIQKQVHSSLQEGHIEEQKLKVLLDQHFEKTEQVLLDYLERLSAATQGGKLPTNEIVQQQRMNLKEKTNNILQKFKKNLTQSVQRTVQPIQEKVTEVKEMIQSKGSQSLISLGNKLTGYGLQLEPVKEKVQAMPSQSIYDEPILNNDKESSIPVFFSAYPESLINNQPLSEAIQTYDATHTAYASLEARLEACKEWVNTQSGHSFEQDQTLILQIGFLVEAMNQPEKQQQSFLEEERKQLEAVKTTPIEERNINQGKEENMMERELTETERQTFKKEYLSYLNGHPLSEEIKTFDRKFGINQGLQVRMDTIEEARLFGGANQEILDEKSQAFAHAFRHLKEEEKESLLTQEYFHKISEPEKELEKAIEEEKEAVKRAYQSFVVNQYNGEHGDVPHSIQNYEEKRGLDAAMDIRQEALRDLMREDTHHVNVLEYAEEVSRHIQDVQHAGREAIQSFKEREQDGQMERGTEREMETHERMKGIQ